MKAITKTLFILSLIAVLAIAVLAWIFIGWQIGVAGLISIIMFLLGYALSEKFAISRRDKYVRSEWGVFCKRISWAWGMAAITYAISYLIIAYLWGDVIDVMPK